MEKKGTKVSWVTTFLWFLNAVMSKSHFLTMKSLPASWLTAGEQKDLARCTLNTAYWYLWQPIRHHPTIIIISLWQCSSWYMCSLYEILYLCGKRETEGEWMEEHLYIIYFLCTPYAWISLCVCVSLCLSACFQAAGQRSRDWRQAGDLGSACVYRCVKCLCRWRIPRGWGNAAARAWGQATRHPGKSTQGWRPCRALRHPARWWQEWKTAAAAAAADTGTFVHFDDEAEKSRFYIIDDHCDSADTWIRSAGSRIRSAGSWIRSGCAVVAARALQVTSPQRLPNVLSVMLRKVAALCLVGPQGQKKPAKKKSGTTQNNIPAANSEPSSWGKLRCESDGLRGCVLERIHLWLLFLPVWTHFLCFHVGAPTAWELNWFERLLCFDPKTIPNNEVSTFVIALPDDTFFQV